MADDLRVNIIVDASQAERALRGVEVQATKIENSMKGVANAATSAASAVTTAANQMASSLNNVTTAALRGQAAVDSLRAKLAARGLEPNTLEDKIFNARQRLSGGGGAASPFPAATGRAYSSLSFPQGIGAAAGLGGAAGAAAGLYFATDLGNQAIGSIDERLGLGFDPRAQELGAAAPLQAAKLLGVDASKAFNDYAAALHTTAAALDDAQRKQAVLNQAVKDGNNLVAQSVAYDQTQGGQFRAARGRLGAGLARFVGSTFFADPDALSGTIGFGSAPVPDAAQPYPGSFVGGLYGGARGLYSGVLDFEAAQRGQQLRLQTFALQAQQALGQGGIDVAAYNRGQYADAAARYRAQLSAGQASYLGGVGGLVNLENQRGRFNESLQFRPGVGYTGTETIFGESSAEKAARIFSDADKFYAGDPEGRASFLALQAANLDPSSLTAEQRDTVRAALDQSIRDQVALLKDQAAVLKGIKALLENAVNHTTGGPGHTYDAEPTPSITAYIKNDSDTAVSIRFADAARNTFTNTDDTLAQDIY